MAKKKKKSRQTPEKNSHPHGRSASTSKTHNEGQAETYRLSKRCFIYLSIPSDRSPALKVSRSLSKINDRIIYINENDACPFSTGNGEKVLVLRIHSKADIKHPNSALDKEPLESRSVKLLFASICTLNIVPFHNKLKSPSKISDTLPRDGQAKFSPPSLSYRMLQCDNDQCSILSTNDSLETHKSKVENITSAKELTPSSVSSGQFSFESFVGTPTNTKKTKINNTTPTSRRNEKRVVLLSFEKYEEAFRSFAREGGHFTLKLIESPSDMRCNVHSLKKSKDILSKMAKALCSGQYFAKDDTIVLSFQGRKIEFVVTLIKELHIDQEPMHIGGITQSLRKMNIGTSKEKGELVSESVDPGIALLCQLKENKTTPFLYRVSCNTAFDFIFEDTAGNDESLSMPIRIKRESECGGKNRVVAGLDAIKSHILSVLIPSLTYPERFPRSGPVRAPKGVLLYGPSGCGKTALASQIENDIKYFSLIEGKNFSRKTIETVCVNCATIQSSISIMGESERKLTKIFEEAEKRALDNKVSTLILLDDVHLICPRRGAAAGGNTIERVASTLLALIDGIGRNKSTIGRFREADRGCVAILAITANPSSLDPALRRAGRLDTEIEVPSPDDKAKCDILNLHITNLTCEGFRVPSLNEECLMKLARLAKGFTGADCALSIKEAVRRAISRHEKSNTTYEKILKPPDIELSTEDISRAIRITKPSTIKSVTVEIPSVAWSSIGGMASVKSQLREAIELPLTHSHLFTALDIPPPRGVLLYGPPGCSKTLMARALATEGGMNFLAVKGPELLSKWLGESERSLAALFHRARLASPCVIFFDEIDAIASKRGSVESSGGERMLSQLLTELDGVTMTAGAASIVKDGKGRPRVVVVGATNRPDLLDNALTRPGRIDRMIYVGLPDEDTRIDILRLNLKGQSCGPDIDYAKLALACEGYSGAEIVSICRESALFAIEEHNLDQYSMPAIHMKHILRSIQNTKKQITRTMLEFYDSFGKNNCGQV